MLNLCLTGDGGFDWNGLAALKTHVDLYEALEIEAVKCVAGDSRHEFQEWYSKYKQKQQKQKQQGGSSPVDEQIDPAQAEQELVMIKQALSETEEILLQHRMAVLAGHESPLTEEALNDTYTVCESLRNNLVMYEDAVRTATRGADDDGGG